MNAAGEPEERAVRGGVAEESNGAPPQPEPLPEHPTPEFEITGVAAVDRAAAPTLRFTARLTDRSDREVFLAALTVLIELEPAKRRHDEETKERLAELFGPAESPGGITANIRWAQVDTYVPEFRGETTFAITVPCTYDLEVAAAKYLYGLADGEAPLRFHFNGQVLYSGEGDRLQIVRVPWECVARYRLPVATWRRMMDAHYPGGGWARLGTETLERLRARRTERGLTSLDATVAELLDREEGR
jgi:hypothetical protein